MFKRNAPVLRVIAMTLVMALSIFATMTMLGCVDHTNTSDEATLKTVISQLEDLKKKIVELDDKLKLICSQIDALTKAMEGEDADLEEIQQELLKLQEELVALEAEELKDRYLTDLKVQSNLIKGLSDNGIVETSAAQNTHDELNDTLSNSISETLEDISDALSDAQERLEELMEGEEEPEESVVVVKDPAQSIISVGIIGNTGSTGGDEGGGDSGGNTAVEAVKIVCPACKAEGVIHKCKYCDDGYTCGGNGHEDGHGRNGPCGHKICYVTNTADPGHQICTLCNFCLAVDNHGYGFCVQQQSSSISTVSEDTITLNNQTIYKTQDEEGVQTFSLHPPCEYCGQPADLGDGTHGGQGCQTHVRCGDNGIGWEHNNTCPTCGEYLCLHNCE